MAIKGKKKGRGSQAKRRPGGAPRPHVYVAPREPWHRTAGGRVAAAVGLVLVLALIGGIVAKVRSDSATRERHQAGIDDFTDEVRSVQQEIAPLAAGLATAPVAPQDDAFGGLAGESSEWAEGFEAASSGTFDVRPPDDLIGALDVFRQSLNLFATAARSYEFAAGLEGAEAKEALARAAEVRDRAIGVWAAATSVLETVRAEAGLDPAAIPPPADPSAAVPLQSEGDEPAGSEEPAEGGGASGESGTENGNERGYEAGTEEGNGGKRKKSGDRGRS